MSTDEIEHLRGSLQAQRQLADDRMRTIARLRLKVRSNDPGFDSLASQLARALERCALEGHRADELHHALNALALEATEQRDLREDARTDLDRFAWNTALEDAEEAPALQKQRPGISVRCLKCGAEHDLAEWEALKFLGLQPQVDLPAEPLELRNCGCGSTLALPLRRLPLTNPPK